MQVHEGVCHEGIESEKGSIPYFAILDKSGKVIDTLLGSVKQKEFLAFLSKAEEEK